MREVTLLVVAAAAAYALGGVNPAVLIARLLGKDVRRAGSGNPGATNAGRVLGRWWGLLVGVIDVAKGLLPAVAANWLWGERPAYVVGVAAVLGHVFSPYLRGRGGRGVATAFGAVLGVHPLYAVSMFAVFVVVAVASQWVGLASMCAAAGLITIGILNAFGRLRGDLWTAVWAIGFGTLVVVRHVPHVRGRWAARRGRAPSGSDHSGDPPGAAGPQA